MPIINRNNSNLSALTSRTHLRVRRVNRHRVIGTPMSIRLNGLRVMRQGAGKISDAELAQARQKIEKRLVSRRQAIQSRRSLALQQQIKRSHNLLDALHSKAKALKASVNDAAVQKHLLEHWAGHIPNIKFSAPSLQRPVSRDKLEGSQAARIILTSAKPTSLGDVKSRLSQLLAVSSSTLNQIVIVRPLFKAFKADRYFVAEFKCARRTLGKDFGRIAFAIKQLGSFANAQIESFRYDLSDWNSEDADSAVPADTEWHLRNTRVFEALRIAPPANGKSGGEGCVIGHPDSGWRPHAQYDEISPSQGRIDTQLAHNIFTGNSGPDAAVHATSPQWIANNLTHGTATGSMMVSAPATAGQTSVGRIAVDRSAAGVEITGVAPLAKVLPVKCIESVVLLGDTALAPAIEYLVNLPDSQRPDVISMSLGGVPFQPLEDLLNEAVLVKNMIAVAAAGQVNGISDVNPFDNSNSVVAPAIFQNVIAVGGSTVEDKPWAESFRGPNVDICAPALNVWFADFREDGSPVIAHGCGTSFSAAQVASIAALWIAFHSRAALKQAYPNTPLAHVFRHMIQATARAPQISIVPFGSSNRTPKLQNWNRGEFGPGIINAEALLAMQLPPESSIQAPPPPADNMVTGIFGMLNVTEEIFASASQWSTGVQRDIAEMLNDGRQTLEEVAQAFNVFAASTLQNAMQEAEDFAAEQAATFQALLDQAGNATQELIDAAEQAMNEAEQAIEDAESALEEMADAVEEGADDAAEFIEDLADQGGDALNEIFSIFS